VGAGSCRYPVLPIHLLCYSLACLPSSSSELLLCSAPALSCALPSKLGLEAFGSGTVSYLLSACNFALASVPYLYFRSVSNSGDLANPFP